MEEKQKGEGRSSDEGTAGGVKKIKEEKRSMMSRRRMAGKGL
jgi:hypothetical protein